MSEGDHDASRQPVSGLGEQHHTPKSQRLHFKDRLHSLGCRPPVIGSLLGARSQQHQPPAHHPVPGAGSQVSPCQTRRGQEGSGRERPGQRLLQPCPWPASMAAILGSQHEFCRAAFPLHWTPRKREDIRTAAAFMGELAVSRAVSGCSEVSNMS